MTFWDRLSYSTEQIDYIFGILCQIVMTLWDRSILESRKAMHQRVSHLFGSLSFSICSRSAFKTLIVELPRSTQRERFIFCYFPFCIQSELL